MTDSNDYRLISADAHVLEPPDLFERLPGQLRSRAPKLARLDGGDAWMVDGSDPVPLPATAASGSGYQRFNLEPPEGQAARVRRRAAGPVRPGGAAQGAGRGQRPGRGPVPLRRALGSHHRAGRPATSSWRCARAYNDWIAEFSAHSPDRLIGLAKIPSTTCEDAREELLRCVKELNLRGAILDAWPSGNAVAGNADDDPFWEAVNEERVPGEPALRRGRGQGDPAAERHRSRA